MKKAEYDLLMQKIEDIFLFLETQCGPHDEFMGQVREHLNQASVRISSARHALIMHGGDK